MKKKILLMTAIAIFGLVTITIAQVPSYVAPNGLVGWWPFNGNANDESGNGNNGTINGATLTFDRNSFANSAFLFNSSINTFIQASIGIQDTMTISAWFNCVAPSTFYGMIYSYGDASATGSTYSGQIMGPHPDWVSLGHVGKFHPYAFSNGYLSEIIPNIFSDNNQWHNMIVTYIPNDKIYLYIDGVYISNSTLNYFPITQGVITFGRDLNNNAGFTTNQGKFDGKIDDIGIWNRSLTQQEVTNLYNGCQLTVSTQPNSQTININNNAQFIAGTSDPSATFQWQTDLGVGFQNLNSVGQYSGTTNDTITVSNVTMSNNNQPFRCIVSSGSCSDTTNVAVLTVNNNVGINETSQDKLFLVFPNPAQSVINVKTDSKLIGEIYSIYDNAGRVVLTGKLNSQNTTIELENLSGGIYMFSVGENMKQTFKVIKEY
jgi:hypothetical protein